METKELQAKAVVQLEAAELIEIQSNEEYEKAGEFLKQVKAVKKEITATFAPIIKKAHEAHKEAKAQEKKHLEPLDKAETIIKPRIAAWIQECERKRIEKQRQLEEEARKRQEEEALKAAAEAETQEEAEEIVQEAIEEKPVVIAPKQHTKIEGIHTVKVKKFRIEDVSKINPKFMIPDEKKIGQLVRSLGKDAESIVGGIKVYFEEQVRSR